MLKNLDIILLVIVQICILAMIIGSIFVWQNIFTAVLFSFALILSIYILKDDIQYYFKKH